MVSNLSILVAQMQVGGEHLAEAAVRLENVAEDESASSTEQSTAVTEITATIEELAATAGSIATTAESVANLAEQTSSASQRGYTPSRSFNPGWTGLASV